MLLIADTGRLEADLGTGRVVCRCGAQLRRWGFAAARRVRMLSAPSVTVRPRRVRCTRCRATHVLLPAWCLPRHADAAEVIGAALIAKAAGHGHKRIAAQLGRPTPTVRGWLRRTRGPHCAWLYRQAVTAAGRLDPDVLNHTEPAGSALGDALTALAAAVTAWRHRFGASVPSWTLAVMFTGGCLLAPPRIDQQVASAGRVCPQQTSSTRTSIASP